MDFPCYIQLIMEKVKNEMVEVYPLGVFKDE